MTKCCERFFANDFSRFGGGRNLNDCGRGMSRVLESQIPRELWARPTQQSTDQHPIYDRLLLGLSFTCAALRTSLDGSSSSLVKATTSKRSPMGAPGNTRSSAVTWRKQFKGVSTCAVNLRMHLQRHLIPALRVQRITCQIRRVKTTKLSAVEHMIRKWT